jgi:protein-S-isoprenylcysteine O-methyltransferase Ste14
MDALALMLWASTVVCALNLTLIATLPTVLFKPGTKHLGWWLTAAPLILGGCGVLAGVLGVGGWSLPGLLPVLLAFASIPWALGSIALISWAGRSHRARLALWHQEDDGPAELVTWGPYRKIRHPLYAAFLMTLVACLLCAPGWTTVVALIAGGVQLNRTAASEEKRLAASTLGRDYSDYMEGTGRFVPRITTVG